VAVLGGALLVTGARAERVADRATAAALAATRSAMDEALAARSATLREVVSRLARVPAYVARAGEALRGDDRADLLDQADEFRAQSGAEWVLVTDAAGVLRAWTDRRDEFGDDLSGGALVGRALGGATTEGVWIEPGPAGARLFQAVGVPLAAPGAGRVEGVLVAALPLDARLAAGLARQTESAVAFFAIDTLDTPRVVASTMADTGHVAALAAAVARVRLPADSALELEAGGREWLGAVGFLRTADGTPVAGYAGLRPRDAELAAWDELRRVIGWAFVLGLLLALGAALVVAHRLARPIRRLAHATRSIGEGEYDVTLDGTVGAGGEVGELAEGFRRMVDALREKEQLAGYASGHAHDAEPAVTPAGALATGMRFAGRYRIERLLGSGAMGVVYRARDEQVGETVAIKTLQDHLVADPRPLERFKQELRLARRITHRNVVRTHDLGQAHGCWYITMEYVEGTSLADLLREKGTLPPPVVVALGRQLCRALEVAHENGVVHRDVKPQNLLLDVHGFLKVMDFGVARLAERDEPAADDWSTLTRTGALVGTPRYMAPEQILGEPVDARADVYAAGAVLYECLTGHPAVTAESLPALMARHAQGAVAADPRRWNPDVPDALARVVLRALAARPDARWQSAGAMREALEAIGVSHSQPPAAER
jgi:serine/threonine-protein kinase